MLVVDGVVVVVVVVFEVGCGGGVERESALKVVYRRVLMLEAAVLNSKLYILKLLLL